MEEFSGGPVVKTWAFTAMDLGSAPGWGTKFPQAEWCGQKKEKKRKISKWKVLLLLLMSSFIILRSKKKCGL